MFGLNQKWTTFIINRRTSQIIKLSNDPIRSGFFNKVLNSRNLESLSQRDLVSAILQTLDLAISIPYENMESELDFYKSSKIDSFYLYSSRPSSLKLLDYTYGFEV